MNKKNATNLANHMKSIVSNKWSVKMVNTECRPGHEERFKVVASGPRNLCIVAAPMKNIEDIVFYVYNVPGHKVYGGYHTTHFVDFQKAWDKMSDTIRKLHTIVVEQLDSLM